MLKELTDAEMVSHSKRPHLQKVRSNQGRIAPTGGEVAGALIVCLGYLFLALGAVHLVVWWLS